MTIHTNLNTENSQIVPILTIKAGRVVANSRDVAGAFGKRHDNILRDIDKLDCSREFASLNFEECTSPHPTVPGRIDRSFNLTRDGFVFLVMGFTGREAARFKEAYITAFNRMEEELRQMGLAIDHDGDDVTAWGLPLRKVDSASRLIGAALRVYGPDAARRLWEKDKSLPNIRRYAIGRMVTTPEDDPSGCLRHLLRVDGGSGVTLGTMLDLALRDKASAPALRDRGISVGPGGFADRIAIADDHPFLRAAFSATQWEGEWRKALILLDGATRTRKTLAFNGRTSAAVLVPRATILALRHGGTH